MAKYRFEQIALNSTEKKKPVAEDRFTYLGLEHLDSGSLKITRFGADVAPVGEKLVMRKGDVLFGKRRAYQKKVAIAPFDGIFSAHGMVLRPKEDVITKNFFPLFISSDYFLDAAIKLSVGSLSPTINWRDLKELEFELPALDEQRELADVLWSITDTMEAYKKLLSATDALVKSQFLGLFGLPLRNPMGWIMRPLEDVIDDILSGECLNGEQRVLGPGERAVLKVSAVTYGYFKDDEYKVIFDLGKIKKNVWPKAGDLLFSRANTREYVGATALVPKDYPDLLLPDKLWKIIPSDSITALFLKYYLRTDEIRNTLSEMATGTSGSMYNISMEKLQKLNFFVPPLPLQKQFTAFVQQVDKSKFAALTCLHQMMRGLLARTGKTSFGASRANHIL